MAKSAEKLALYGGLPVRGNLLPYGRQNLVDEDISSVENVLRSDWLTTGPRVGELEKNLAELAETEFAVAVSSGTAALHSAMFALGIGPGDQVIVPAITFTATANAIIYQGGTPVFVDVDRDTLLIDLEDVQRKLNAKTRAIVSVDYAGQPCQYEALIKIAQRHRVALIADSCHAMGSLYKGSSVGSLVDMSIFSFHPVKLIASGEGGVITTNDRSIYKELLKLRSHGINKLEKKLKSFTKGS